MDKIILGNKIIGNDAPCFIIGEVGLNHNGDISIAKRLIDAAKEANVDCVKFQKRNVDALAIESVLDAEDMRFPEFGRTYREIRKYLEFDEAQYREIIDYVDSKGLTFLCTAFDIPSVQFLERFNVPGYKIASHSITNLPLLEKISTLRSPVIMSTGMCMWNELDQAVDIFISKKVPLVVLHCVSSYPQSEKESNLKLIKEYSQRYNVPVGYSGHELGYFPTLLSVAMGAKVVERHITLDKKMVGFDHKLSLEPHELKEMVDKIRHIERIAGSGKKFISEKEQITRDKYHVSIVSACYIKAGEEITAEKIGFKNPGTGLAPSRVKSILGAKAKRDIPEDAIIDMDMFKF